MTLNDTITAINYAKDVDYEWNIKLLLLLFFLVIALVSLYIGYKDNYDTEARSFFNILLLCFGWLTLFFSPLYVFFLLRAVSLNIIMNYIFLFYLVIVSGSVLLILLYLGEKFISYLFGTSFVDKKYKNRQENDYRKVERD